MAAPAGSGPYRAASGGRRLAAARAGVDGVAPAALSDPYGADDVSPRTAPNPPDEDPAVDQQPSSSETDSHTVVAEPVAGLSAAGEGGAA